MQVRRHIQRIGNIMFQQMEPCLNGKLVDRPGHTVGTQTVQQVGGAGDISQSQTGNGITLGHGVQQQLTRKAVESLPGIEGVNNHQGSKATSNEATMKAVLKVLKQQGLFFVDSSTYSKSIGDQVARSMGVPTAHNNIFLDNSSDEDDIIAKIWQAVEMADRNGSAIAICHARPHTAAAWSKVIDEVNASGIQLVPVSSLLK